MVRNGRALRLYLFGNESQPFPETDAKAALTKAGVPVARNRLLPP